MNRSLAVAIAAFTLTSSAGCSGSHTGKNDAVAILVQIARTHSATFQTALQLSGILQAAHTVTVGASTAGRLTDVPVRVGDRVGAGEPVAQIDTAAYRATLSQAQGAVQAAAANVGVSRAQLQAAQSHYELARATARRMSLLYSQGAISKQQQDETQAEFAAAKAAVAQAQAAVNAAAGSEAQSEGGVSSASVPLQQTMVVAPFSGIVTAKLADAGAVVQQGSPIVSIQTDRDLELDLTVPEDAAATLRIGTPVVLRVDALGSRSLQGHIRAVVPSENGDLHAASVKVSLQAVPGMLPGMFARAELRAGRYSGTAVPMAALVNRAGQDGVFAIRNGRAHFVPVQTGVSGGGRVELEHLPPGITQVAVTNVARLTDGDRVTVQDP